MKILIQPNCGIPIYLQVAERIIWNISWRKLKMGDALPPTRVLAAENGLDHKTVAKGYAELRSQGVAFPHRPTGSYIIMSQAQHLAEVKRDAFIKVMECLLRAIRMLRRMPPELEPSKSIQEYFQKLKDCETQINELNAVISAESSKPAASLPGVVSPLGIDEALARMADSPAMGSPSPVGTPNAALATDENSNASATQPDPATNAQQVPNPEAPWNNSQSGAGNLACHSAQTCPTQDSAWNNGKNSATESEQKFAQNRTTQDELWNNPQSSSSGSQPPTSDLNCAFINSGTLELWNSGTSQSPNPKLRTPAHPETPPDTSWNNSLFSASNAGLNRPDSGHSLANSGTMEL